MSSMEPHRNLLENLKHEIDAITFHNVSYSTVLNIHKKFCMFIQQCKALETVDIEVIAECCRKFINLIQNFVDSTSTLRQRKIDALKECLQVIKEISILRGAKNAFLIYMCKPMFEKVAEPDIKIWFAHELMNCFNSAVRGTNRKLRHVFVEKNVFTICILADIICNCGDLMYQLALLEAIFHMCSPEQINQYAQQMFPTSVEFVNGIRNINRRHFDCDTRVFLNMVNATLKTVLSLKCYQALLGNVEIGQLKCVEEETDLWVDFNIGSKTITINCDSDSLRSVPVTQTLSNEDNGFELITIYAENVEHIKMRIKKQINSSESMYLFNFKMTQPCTVRYNSSFVVANSPELKLAIRESVEVEELITTILPEWFGNKFMNTDSSQETVRSQSSQEMKNPSVTEPRSPANISVRSARSSTSDAMSLKAKLFKHSGKNIPKLKLIPPVSRPPELEELKELSEKEYDQLAKTQDNKKLKRMREFPDNNSDTFKDQNSQIKTSSIIETENTSIKRKDSIAYHSLNGPSIEHEEPSRKKLLDIVTEDHGIQQKIQKQPNEITDNHKYITSVKHELSENSDSYKSIINDENSKQGRCNIDMVGHGFVKDLKSNKQTVIDNKIKRKQLNKKIELSQDSDIFDNQASVTEIFNEDNNKLNNADKDFLPEKTSESKDIEECIHQLEFEDLDNSIITISSSPASPGRLPASTADVLILGELANNFQPESNNAWLKDLSDDRLDTLVKHIKDNCLLDEVVINESEGTSKTSLSEPLVNEHLDEVSKIDGNEQKQGGSCDIVESSQLDEMTLRVKESSYQVIEKSKKRIKSKRSQDGCSRRDSLETTDRKDEKSTTQENDESFNFIPQIEIIENEAILNADHKHINTELVGITPKTTSSDEFLEQKKFKQLQRKKEEMAKENRVNKVSRKTAKKDKLKTSTSSKELIKVNNTHGEPQNKGALNEITNINEQVVKKKENNSDIILDQPKSDDLQMKQSYSNISKLSVGEGSFVAESNKQDSLIKNTVDSKSLSVEVTKDDKKVKKGSKKRKKQNNSDNPTSSDEFLPMKTSNKNNKHEIIKVKINRKSYVPKKITRMNVETMNNKQEETFAKLLDNVDKLDSDESLHQSEHSEVIKARKGTKPLPLDDESDDILNNEENLPMRKPHDVEEFLDNSFEKMYESNNKSLQKQTESSKSVGVAREKPPIAVKEPVKDNSYNSNEVLINGQCSFSELNEYQSILQTNTNIENENHSLHQNKQLISLRNSLNGDVRISEKTYQDNSHSLHLNKNLVTKTKIRKSLSLEDNSGGDTKILSLHSEKPCKDDQNEHSDVERDKTKENYKDDNYSLHQGEHSEVIRSRKKKILPLKDNADDDDIEMSNNDSTKLTTDNIQILLQNKCHVVLERYLPPENTVCDDNNHALSQNSARYATTKEVLSIEDNFDDDIDNFKKPMHSDHDQSLHQCKNLEAVQNRIEETDPFLKSTSKNGNEMLDNIQEMNYHNKLPEHPHKQSDNSSNIIIHEVITIKNATSQPLVGAYTDAIKTPKRSKKQYKSAIKPLENQIETQLDQNSNESLDIDTSSKQQVSDKMYNRRRKSSKQTDDSDNEESLKKSKIDNLVKRKKRILKEDDSEIKSDTLNVDVNETSKPNEKRLKRKIECRRSRSKTRKLYKLNDSASYLEVSNVEQEVVTLVDENSSAVENSTVKVINKNVKNNSLLLNSFKNQEGDPKQQNQIPDHLEIQTETDQSDADHNTFQNNEDIEDNPNNHTQENLFERIFSAKLKKEKLTRGVTSVKQTIEDHSVINQDRGRLDNKYKFDLLIQSIDTTLNLYSKKMNSYHKNLKNKGSMRDKYKRLSDNCRSNTRMKRRNTRNSNCQIQSSEVNQNDLSIVLLNISQNNELDIMEQEESGEVLKLKQKLDAVTKEMKELKRRIAKLESLCKSGKGHSI